MVAEAGLPPTGGAMGVSGELSSEIWKRGSTLGVVADADEVGILALVDLGLGVTATEGRVVVVRVLVRFLLGPGVEDVEPALLAERLPGRLNGPVTRDDEDSFRG